MTIESIAIAYVIFTGVGAAIGQRKGRTAGGFFLGLFLGPVGWLLLLVGKNYSKD